MGKPLNSDVIFPSLAMYTMLMAPIESHPVNMFQWFESQACIQRIQRFLLSRELVSLTSGPPCANLSIQMNGATFSYDESSLSEAVLSDINFCVPHGSLVGIFGNIGSGKSSILNAVFQQMYCLSGTVKISGKSGLCPQIPWTKSGTIKENILFGSNFDKDKYEQVLRVCELAKDLSLLPNGDETLIGDKGMNLSGGQKQRINLARLAYSSSTILLLDDPLSAVDATLGKKIFENCIGKFMKDKTRLLVTHHLHLMPLMDHIVILENGRIIHQGTFANLQSEASFRKLVNSHSLDGYSDSSGMAQPDSSFGSSTPSVSVEEISEMDDEADLVQHEGKTTVLLMDYITKVPEPEIRGRHLYSAYFKFGGGLKVFIIALSFVIVSAIFSLGSDLWISYWTENKFDLSLYWYMGIFAAITLGVVLFRLLSHGLFIFIGYKAAIQIFHSAFTKVLLAPMEFFDSTPVGKIISRLSKDQQRIDFGIATPFSNLLRIVFDMACTFLMVCVILPWFIVPLVIMLMAFYLIQFLFRKALQNFLNLESEIRASSLALLSEAIAGVMTINAYEQSDSFLKVYMEKVEQLSRIIYSVDLLHGWLFSFLGILGNLLLLISSLLCIFLNIPAAISGLILGSLLAVSGQMFSLISYVSTLETDMAAVDKVISYSHSLESEKPHYLESSFIPEVWPSKGQIQFKDLNVAYSKKLPPILKNFSLEIKAGTRVGVVGRSGSGKSTIMLSLFRIIEPLGGSIFIDQVDISNVGLSRLRSALAIIPQDPILFSGTIRSNLDPFEKFTDEEIWKALEASALKSIMELNGYNLDTEVEESGRNFSNGQRQLFCLSRALLAKSKILILDEATSNVDHETDSKIQQAVRENFKQSTILAIAHRLDTIIDYDMILVMDSGCIVEYDTPAKLLADPQSKFYALARDNSSTFTKK